MNFAAVRGREAQSPGRGAVAHVDGSTTAIRRKLAASLRRLRERSGRSAAEVAVHLDCPLRRFQLIEVGMASVRLAEVRGALDLYEISGEERGAILAEAKQARDRSWWYPYADLIDESFETHLILENDAAALRTYQPNLVPGLLQTERYAWELIGTRSDLPLETVRRQADLRAMRRKVLDREDAPILAVVLDEAVLRRPVGALSVMREQYGHLFEIANEPGVTIQVLPFKAGPHHAMGTGFHIFEFAGEEQGVVELELLDRLDFVAEYSEVAHYAAAFERASQVALDAERSGALLQELALSR
jgi:hypothetical protein